MSPPCFNALEVANKIPQEFRKFSRNCYQLRHILRQTKEALNDISSANIFPTENICGQALTTTVVEKLSNILDRHPTILVLGQNCHAKATLINVLLGEPLLPTGGAPWRWVRIHYGHISGFSVALGLTFEEGNAAETHERSWTTVPEENLRRPENEKLTVEHSTVLKVQICHPLLRDNVQLIVPPDQDAADLVTFQQILHSGLAQVLPVLLFALGEETLTDQNIHELRELKEVYPDLPLLFICTSGSLPSPKSFISTAQESSKSKDCELQENTSNTDVCSSCSTETEHHHLLEEIITNPSIHGPCALLHQLASIGYLHLEEAKECSTTEDCSVTTKPCCGKFSMGSDFLDNLHKLDQLVSFVRGCLQAYLIQAANLLNEVQGQCLRRFILSAFDMAREIQITPRRIQYAQEKEAELYKNLMIIASEKQEEIQHLIQGTLQEMRSELVERAAEYHYHGVTLLESEEVGSLQEVRVATSEVHYLVLSRLSNAVAAQLVKSVDCLQDTYVGTLQRCLESLERNCLEQEGNLLASDAVKQVVLTKLVYVSI